MIIHLKLEYISVSILFSYVLFINLDKNLLLLLVLFFTPDLSMLGYLLNSKIGSYMYNFIHSEATGAFLLLLGMISETKFLTVVGALLLAHTFLDRFFGYGLKYPDSFKNTHLGKIK